jgi:hypothetical protein
MSHKLNSAIAVIGIDIGKNSFHVVGHDKRGAITHHLSRKLQKLGHDARLMPATAIGTGEAFSKGRDFGAWLGLVPKQISTPETEQSSAGYQNAAIAICAPCSSRRPGWYWSGSGQNIGSAMGSSRGSKRRRGDCITTFLPSGSPTSSRALLGASWLMAEPSRPARLKPRDSTRTVETPYLPCERIRNEMEDRSSRRMRTLVTRTAPIEAYPVMRSHAR